MLPFKLKISSLQSRLTLLLVLPMVLILVGVGGAGFFITRNLWLERWQESALLSLERAAQTIDLRLAKPEELVALVAALDRAHGLPGFEGWLLDRIRALPGVRGAELVRSDPRGGSGRWFVRAVIDRISPPLFDPRTKSRQVAVGFSLLDGGEREAGRLKVVMGLDYLLEEVTGLEWWQSEEAFLVDSSGLVLASTGGGPGGRERLGENQDRLELDLLRAMDQAPKGTVRGPGHPSRRVAGFYRVRKTPWTIVLFAAGEKVLAPIIKYRDMYLLGVLICIGGVIILIKMVVGPMVRSIREVSQAAGRVARGEYGEPLPPGRADEIGRLVDSFNAMVSGLQERDRIRDAFGRYVDPEVARYLMGGPEATRLGGKKQEVAIMMSDIRDFTSLCEFMEPEQTIRVINRYLARMIEVIQFYKGIIVDFLGDAVLVFFDPFGGPLEHAVRRAVCCALAMQRSTQALNQENAELNLPELKTGIGLNAGEVVVGNIGSETRTKYGIIGAPVNLTNRLQSLAEGGQIMVSESVRTILKDQLDVAYSFETEVKGIASAVKVHALSPSATCAEVDGGLVMIPGPGG